MAKPLPISLALLFALLLAPAVLADEPEAKEDTDAAVIKLVAAGAEPHAVVRYKPTAESKFNLDLSMQIEVEQAMGAMAFPTVVVKGGYEVLKVADNGDFTLKSTFSELTTEGEDPSGMGAMLLGSLDTLKDLTMTATASCAGRVKSAEFSEIEIVDPMQEQMYQSIRSMADGLVTPLPEEAVGIGAKWSIEKEIDSSGIKIKQTTTYEMVKIEADRIELKMTISQTADKQTVQHPMGFPMEVNNVTGSGSGVMTLDLVTTLATTSKLEMSTQLDCAIDMGMGPQALNQVVKVTTTSKTGPAKAATPDEGSGEK